MTCTFIRITNDDPHEHEGRFRLNSIQQDPGKAWRKDTVQHPNNPQHPSTQQRDSADTGGIFQSLVNCDDYSRLHDG